IQGLIEHYSLLLNPNAPISAPVPTEQHQEDEFEQIAATFAHIEAAYIDAFRRTVERVGTENFPAQALAKNLVGNVRLLVAIQARSEERRVGKEGTPGGVRVYRSRHNGVGSRRAS